MLKTKEKIEIKTDKPESSIKRKEKSATLEFKLKPNQTYNIGQKIYRNGDQVKATIDDSGTPVEKIYRIPFKMGLLKVTEK